MKNNGKLITLTASFLLLFISGVFLLPIAKATETYTTTESYQPIKDSFVNELTPDTNYGGYPIWLAGFDTDSFNFITAYYCFNISSIPNDAIKIQIKIPIQISTVTNSIMASIGITYDSWEENSITFNNNAINMTDYITNIDIHLDMISGYYLTDITTKVEGHNEITIINGGWNYDSYGDPMQGWCKEGGDNSLVPSIIYTFEHEIIPQQTNEIPFLIIGLSIGLVIGFVAVSVVIILNKRKSKF